MDSYKYICNIIENNNGKVTSSNELLINTGIDSFGVITVLLEMDNEFDVLTGVDFDKIDYNNLSIQNILDGEIKCI